MMEYFYLYILCCADGSYYVGHTDNLDKRFADHQDGIGSVFTSKRLPVKLIYSYLFGSREDVFVAERKLKGWSREKKEAFIAENWDLLSELAKSGSNKESV